MKTELIYVGVAITIFVSMITLAKLNMLYPEIDPLNKSKVNTTIYKGEVTKEGKSDLPTVAEIERQTCNCTDPRRLDNPFKGVFND